ncbi:MAG: SPFH domain-containing protein [Aggregatilineales bacterium]|nr:SPFH domain-containing protein [Aggregatilineales bacterium]HPV07332.1 SPFH domain-containing protein [Aggregatilineales bacterium]
MAIKAVFGFLITLFAIAIIAGIGLVIVNSQRGRRVRPGVIIAVVGVIGVLVLAPLNAGLVLIQPNEAGVVFRQITTGEDSLLTPLEPGLRWVVPFIDQVVIYDVGQQSVTLASEQEAGVTPHSPVRAISSDGQVINLDVTVIYRIDRAKVNEVHRNWRGSYLDGFIIPQVRSEVRDAISEYGAEMIYSGGRSQLESQIFDALREKFEREGFLLSDFLVRDISFSPEFTDAIERKQIAEQDAQRARFLVQQAEQAAEQRRVEARGEADAAVIAAEGQAQAIVVQAEAEAEALRLINAQLSQNPNLIQWRYVEQLSDQVQLILIPSNSPFLFDIQQLMDQQAAGEASGSQRTIPTPPAEEQPTEEEAPATEPGG